MNFQRPKIISASIISSNFSKLGQEIVDVTNAGADWIHLDIMDGHFVPNITFGPDLIKAIRPLTNVIFDAHLMIYPCDSYIQTFAEAGCDIITIHVESSLNFHKSLKLIRQTGKKVGISLKPETNEDFLKNVLEDIDLILVMSVNPGFSGQKFIPKIFDKISNIKKIIGNNPIDLSVDGGINLENIEKIVQLGANVYVSGSEIYKGNDYIKKISLLRKIIENSKKNNSIVSMIEKKKRK